uniref:Uncharacterized protein n=1 Tax=Kalanchoe fedtschenkoi TaxID=63787 RepID=A0A7N0UX40_KALFE
MCYSTSLDPFSSASSPSSPPPPRSYDAPSASSGRPEMGVTAITSGVMRQQCICSPTSHPGSFRCRQHHGDYRWAAAAN